MEKGMGNTVWENGNVKYEILKTKQYNLVGYMSITIRYCILNQRVTMMTYK